MTLIIRHDASVEVLFPHRAEPCYQLLSLAARSVLAVCGNCSPTRGTT